MYLKLKILLYVIYTNMESQNSLLFIVALSSMGGVVVSVWICCCIFWRKVARSTDEQYQAHYTNAIESYRDQVTRWIALKEQLSVLQALSAPDRNEYRD